ncbi:MAG: hypothetical protein IJ424_07280 [Oscillospiraceae bacterium]|nr:hypothetical protein [Oscillospiraceae bacterium]
MKIKFNNDELLLATILGAIDKINLDNALANKDLKFKENVYTVIEDFTTRLGEAVEASVIDMSHNIPTY